MLLKGNLLHKDGRGGGGGEERKRDRRSRERVGLRNGLFLMMSGGRAGEEVERVTEMLISHLEAGYKYMRNKNPSECRSSKKNATCSTT